MFSRLARTLAIAGAAASLAGSAPHANAGQAQQTSSPVWWSAAGDHADLVIRYDNHATAPLTVVSSYVLDAGGYNVSELVETCGTPIKSGDTVTSYQLEPGQYCFIRAYRGSQQDEIVGKAVLSDSTSGTANIAQFVHASLEVRDVSDNVLTHVEVY